LTVPKLVFLHGMALDGGAWRPQLDAFPGALAPDIPGFGSRQLEGVADLSELEATVEGAHVVGHSFGAAVATDLALRRSRSMRSLTLVSPLLLGRASNLSAWPLCVELAKAGDVAGARAAWLGCPLFDDVREQLRPVMAGYRGGHWTGATRTDFRQPDPASQLGTLDLPVLVVSGTRDQAPFRAMAREYHEGLRNSRLEELDAGHLAPREHPDRFNALLASFLAEQR
jgi:pimeloyl-ACP methyl ester carboxylesterase